MIVSGVYILDPCFSNRHGKKNKLQHSTVAMATTVHKQTSQVSKAAAFADSSKSGESGKAWCIQVTCLIQHRPPDLLKS